MSLTDDINELRKDLELIKTVSNQEISALKAKSCVVGTIVQSILTLEEFRGEKGEDGKNWYVCDGSEVPKECRYMELKLDKKLNAKDGCTPDLTGKFISQGNKENFQKTGDESINAELLNVQMNKNLSVSGSTQSSNANLIFVQKDPFVNNQRGSTWGVNWSKLQNHSNYKFKMRSNSNPVEITEIAAEGCNFIFQADIQSPGETYGNGHQMAIQDIGHKHEFVGYAKGDSTAFTLSSDGIAETKPKHINLNFFIRVN